jgi:hypothetical protein
MASPVDESLWTVRPAFGVAGGPDEHALTDAGLALAFAVGARVRRGASTEALMALAASGGAGALSERVTGAHVRPTALGKFDQIAWGYLRAAGLVVSTGPDDISLTPQGRAAIERGHAEQRSLLERVRAAHPLSKGAA